MELFLLFSGVGKSTLALKSYIICDYMGFPHVITSYVIKWERRKKSSTYYYLHMHMVLHTERTSVLRWGRTSVIHWGRTSVIHWGHVVMSECPARRGTVQTLPTTRRMQLWYT